MYFFILYRGRNLKIWVDRIYNVWPSSWLLLQESPDCVLFTMVLENTSKRSLSNSEMTGVVSGKATERMWLLVEPRAGPEQSEAPHPLPCPWSVCLPTAPTAGGSVFRTQPWEGSVLRLSGHNMWLNSLKPSLQTFKVLVRGWGYLLVLKAPKTALQVNLFIKPAIW